MSHGLDQLAKIVRAAGRAPTTMHNVVNMSSSEVLNVTRESLEGVR